MENIKFPSHIEPGPQEPCPITKKGGNLQTGAKKVTFILKCYCSDMFQYIAIFWDARKMKKCE